MARPKGEGRKQVGVPLGCLEEVLAVIERYRATGRSSPALHPVERSVQRSEPTAPSGIPTIPTPTVGVEAKACPDCGKLVAYPQRWGNHHHRRCGRFTERDVIGQEGA